MVALCCSAFLSFKYYGRGSKHVPDEFGDSIGDAKSINGLS